jgi:hypothetical protein
MSFFELPWDGLYLGTTPVDASGLNKNILEWHSGGSNLFIFGVGEHDVDIRMDREVYLTWVSACITDYNSNKLTLNKVPGIFC